MTITIIIITIIIIIIIIITIIIIIIVFFTRRNPCCFEILQERKISNGFGRALYLIWPVIISKLTCRRLNRNVAVAMGTRKSVETKQKHP